MVFGKILKEKARCKSRFFYTVLFYIYKMKLPHYSLNANRDFNSFEFVSIGPKGKIKKAIQFIPIDNDNVYNLVFGDRVNDRIINDSVVTENRDTEKVLATVANAVLLLPERILTLGFMLREFQNRETAFIK